MMKNYRNNLSWGSVENIFLLKFFVSVMLTKFRLHFIPTKTRNFAHLPTLTPLSRNYSPTFIPYFELPRFYLTQKIHTFSTKPYPSKHLINYFIM